MANFAQSFDNCRPKFVGSGPAFRLAGYIPVDNLANSMSSVSKRNDYSF